MHKIFCIIILGISLGIVDLFIPDIGPIRLSEIIGGALISCFLLPLGGANAFA